MTHTIVMPDLGQTTTEGRILKWLKSPGNKVQRGEALLEVETDKATMEVEAYAEGYLREVFVSEREMAAALSPIAILTDTADEPYERPGEKAAARTVPVESSPAAPPSTAADRTRVMAAPAARSLALDLHVDLNLVSGTGPNSLITRKDVERHAAERAVPRAISAVAALTVKSKQTIPHFYVTVDADMSAAEQWRAHWNAIHPDLTASANDVFVRAVSQALRDVPGLNVAYRDGKLEPRATADVLLVVAVESGLRLVPIPAAVLSCEEYLRTMKACIDKARRGRVTEPYPSGTPLLAISNLGMFGVKQFAAIIPPACTAILAIGATREEPRVVNQQVVVGKVCSLTLSVDHRVADGIIAAKFLERMQVHLNSL